MDRTITAPLLLGIDIGTTSLAAQVISADSGDCIRTYSIRHNAAITLPDYPDAFAADAERLIELAVSLAQSAVQSYPTIAAIGLTGQMHGIVCIDETGEILSPLYTWQNQFGLRQIDGDTAPTICEEIVQKCGVRIPTGYGITTYYALKRLGLLPERTAKIVTVMDLLGMKLTNTAPAMHPTNAAALGAYQIEARAFDRAILEKLRIPLSVLPAVTDDYACMGNFTVSGRSIPVSIAIGDNQAGLFGALADDSMILINVGTGSQITLLSDRPSGGEVRPYFDGKFALSGAALCGGRAYAILADFIQSIAAGLGQELSRDTVYDYLNEAAERGFQKEDSLRSPRVSTCFSGTRTEPDRRGSIAGIDTDNFTPEALSVGFLRGIIEELHELYCTIQPNRDPAPRAVIGGNAMRKNPVLQKLCGEYFHCTPLLPLHTEEAAFGAALYGGVCAGLFSRSECYSRIQYHPPDPIKEDL